jgi:hypothetical protein
MLLVQEESVHLSHLQEGKTLSKYFAKLDPTKVPGQTAELSRNPSTLP